MKKRSKKLLTIASGGTLTLVAVSGTGTLAAAISGGGTLELGGATTLGTAGDSVANILIDPGASLGGRGTLSSLIVNNGTLAAVGGTLVVSGGVTSPGLVSAGADALLELHMAFGDPR